MSTAHFGSRRIPQSSSVTVHKWTQSPNLSGSPMAYLHGIADGIDNTYGHRNLFENALDALSLGPYAFVLYDQKEYEFVGTNDYALAVDLEGRFGFRRLAVRDLPEVKRDDYDWSEE